MNQQKINTSRRKIATTGEKNKPIKLVCDVDSSVYDDETFVFIAHT